MISDDKVIEFKNAKTVWVEHKGEWVEMFPYSIEIFQDSELPWRVHQGHEIYSYKKDFKLEKPQDKPKDWEICWVWDDGNYKDLTFYYRDRFHGNLSSGGIVCDNFESTGLFIPEKHRKGMK